MAFENISKGEFTIFDKDVYSSEDGIICLPSKFNNFQGNMDFIAFCFNLQQRYDIGKLEEAVKLLEFANSDELNYENSLLLFDKIEQLLKQIKK